LIKEILNELLDLVKLDAKLIISKIETSIQLKTVYRPIINLISKIKPLISAVLNDKSLEPIHIQGSKNITGIHRALYGIMHPPLDSVYKPTFSVLKKELPKYGESLVEAAPYYWCLSARECMASDMCNLMLMEYDGMPIDFYYDMAKQAWDEIRHSVFFLEVAEKLIPKLILQLRECDPLYQCLKEYQLTKSGLPIPLEKNLYEAIWNATLFERLILMHHDTETPGIKRIKSRIESGFNQQYPFIVNGLEVVMREEITHARLGKRWIKYLVPHKDTLDEAIKQTRMLRGVLLLTSCAHHQKKNLTGLLSELCN
jgi:hypothetical protein